MSEVDDKRVSKIRDEYLGVHRFHESWKLVYEWVKTDVINFATFKEICRLIVLWEKS